MDRALRQEVLAFVRRVVEDALTGQRTASPPECLRGMSYGGVFVTLRIGGRLRGCMGRLTPRGELYTALDDIARLTLNDPRFVRSPLRADELSQLRIEVSILTQPHAISDPRTLEPGRHGIAVSQGSKSGCFLPQVATEQGWDMETMLTMCCVHKAGLPAGAWREPGVRVEAFEARVLRDEDDWEQAAASLQ